MKRNLIIFITAITAIIFTITGCSENKRTQEAKALAESYLSELKASVSDETLYITDTDAERYGEIIAFTAYSKKYGDDFKIYVNSDNSISDSYFAVSLKASAEREFAQLITSVLPDETPDFELTVDKNITALSAKTFSTVKESHEALNNTIGLIKVVIKPSKTDAISEEALDILLTAMQNECFYGELSIDNDVRVFHISAEEINYTRTDDPSGEVMFYEWQPQTGE